MRSLMSFLLAALVVSTACDGSHTSLRSPTAPSASTGPPPATPGASPNATPINLGQAVTGVLTLADPPCGTAGSSDPPEPCRQFAITVPTSGILSVQATTPGPSGLTLQVGGALRWGYSVTGTAMVQGGATYTLSVALHGGTTSQTFELTTTLDPS
jgi:hypothetical protein